MCEVAGWCGAYLDVTRHHIVIVAQKLGHLLGDPRQQRLEAHLLHVDLGVKVGRELRGA